MGVYWDEWVCCGVWDAVVGVIPGLKMDGLLGGLLGGCENKKGRFKWIGILAGEGGVVARILLGATMGFLPCGLVYGMLMVAAGLGGPMEGGFGMLAFGLGTVPSLTGF